MRYLEDESTYILSNFTTGDTVTITVYKLSDNSKIIDAAACTEISTTGRFKYSFSQSISTKTEYLWIAENGTEEQQGKIILGGYPDGIITEIDANETKIDTLQTDSTAIKAKTDTIDWTDIDTIIDEIGGKWELVGNQMIFYKADNATEIMRFNLFDSGGNPAMVDVYKRERVP